jgi:hypothetical protein
MLRLYLEAAERKAADKERLDAQRKQQALADMAAANDHQLQLHAEQAAKVGEGLPHARVDWLVMLRG